MPETEVYGTLEAKFLIDSILCVSTETNVSMNVSSSLNILSDLTVYIHTSTSRIIARGDSSFSSFAMHTMEF